MRKLGRWCAQYRYGIIGFWLVLLVGMGLWAGSLGSAFRTEVKLANTESVRAGQIVNDITGGKSPSGDAVVFSVSDGDVMQPRVRDRVEAAKNLLSQWDKARSVLDYTDPLGAAQIAPNGQIAYLSVDLGSHQGSLVTAKEMTSKVDALRALSGDGVEVAFGGPTVSEARTAAIKSTELAAILAAAVVLYLVFGSIVAMLIPLVVAIFALGVSTAAVTLLSHVFPVADFTPALSSLLALGVGIDYALFIVSRHRANLRRGVQVRESLRLAVATSGRAVLFAGFTVCIALLGLLVVRLSFLDGAAIAASVAVFITMCAAITLVPAVASFTGMHVLNRREKRFLAEEGPIEAVHQSPRWYAIANFVGAHRVLCAVSAVALLATLAVPVFGMRLGALDSANDPKGTSTRVAYDLIAEGFGPGANAPIILAAKTGSVMDNAQFEALMVRLAAHPDVASVSPMMANPEVQGVMTRLTTKSSPQAKITEDFITELRHEIVPAYATPTLKVEVGGSTALFEDIGHEIRDRMPEFMAAVIGLAFLLLLVVFRSVVIPITASIMNLLAAGAAFGIVVAVFQWGWLGGLFGVEQPGPIMVFLPVMLFAILFGLSMDYEVFLISRIHEEWERRHDNEQAIAIGQAESGRVITAAATIMIVVFLAFLLGDNYTIKLFALGLAGAVFVDAIVIRTLLLPALMYLLGRSNWYAPSVLTRWLPKVRVE